MRRASVGQVRYLAVGLFVFDIVAMTMFSISVFALLGSGVAVKLAPHDPCTCLRFKEVYNTKKVRCGQAFEFFHANGSSTLEEHFAMVNNLWNFSRTAKLQGKHVCNLFYRKLDDNVCMKKNELGELDGTDGWRSEFWCYVSDQCKGSVPIMDREAGRDSGFAFKTCVQGQDKLASDMGVEELYEWERSMDIRETLQFRAFSLAYPFDYEFPYKTYVHPDGRNYTDEERMEELLRRVKAKGYNRWSAPWSWNNTVETKEPWDDCYTQVAYDHGKVYKLLTCSPNRRLSCDPWHDRYVNSTRYLLNCMHGPCEHLKESRHVTCAYGVTDTGRCA